MLAANVRRWDNTFILWTFRPWLYFYVFISPTTMTLSILSLFLVYLCSSIAYSSYKAFLLGDYTSYLSRTIPLFACKIEHKPITVQTKLSPYSTKFMNKYVPKHTCCCVVASFRPHTLWGSSDRDHTTCRSENGCGLSYSRSRNPSLLLTREAEVINTNLNLFSRYPDSTFAAIDTVEWQDHVFSKSVSKRK